MRNNHSIQKVPERLTLRGLRIENNVLRDRLSKLESEMVFLRTLIQDMDEALRHPQPQDLGTPTFNDEYPF